MVTKAKELAKILGVSPATVSLVLNNRPGISDSLRHKLVEKIKELGYEDMLATAQTDSNGKAMRSSRDKRNTIVYLIYTKYGAENDRFAFYPAVLQGAEMEARDNEFTLLVFHVNEKGNNYLQSMIKNTNAVGVIVQSDKVTESIISDLTGIELPTVFIDAYDPNSRHSSVCINNEQGILFAVKHLKSMGHTKIGYISSGAEGNSAIERRKSFHQALRELELEDNRENYYNSRGDSEVACRNLANAWKEAPPTVTAMMCEHDLVAWRAIKALQKLGYNVPGDISIIGFDNRSVCEMIEPRLTSVNNHRHLMGREAVMMIQNKIRLNQLGFVNTSLKFELPTELITRDSVRNLLEEN